MAFSLSYVTLAERDERAANSAASMVDILKVSPGEMTEPSSWLKTNSLLLTPSDVIGDGRETVIFCTSSPRLLETKLK